LIFLGFFPFLLPLSSTGPGSRRLDQELNPLGRTRPALELVSNPVINTDRRTYLLELRSAEKTYTASVSRQYPEDQLIALRRQNASAETVTPRANAADGAAGFGRRITDRTEPDEPTAQSAADDTFTQNGQDRKLAFLSAEADRRATSPDRVAAPASPYVVQAGNVIPASLITGIRSDLPGQITAQVTENVYDSPTGRFLLIPLGARLIGIYDSQVAFGQSRMLLVWTRLIMPNGRSIVLERQPGADTAGYSGLEDEVDNHWGAQFKAALLSTLLGVGSQLGATTGAGMNADVITALRRGTSDSMNQTGERAVQRNLNIQPTLTIRPGFPVRVIVNRDLVLEPYKG